MSSTSDHHLPRWSAELHRWLVRVDVVSASQRRVDRAAPRLDTATCIPWRSFVLVVLFTRLMVIVRRGRSRKPVGLQHWNHRLRRPSDPCSCAFGVSSIRCIIDGSTKTAVGQMPVTVFKHRSSRDNIILHDCITDVRLLPVCSTRCSIYFRLCYTLPRDWYARHGSTTTWLRHTVTFIGYTSPAKNGVPFGGARFSPSARHCTAPPYFSADDDSRLLSCDQHTQRSSSFRDRSTRRPLTARFQLRWHGGLEQFAPFRLVISITVRWRSVESFSHSRTLHSAERWKNIDNFVAPELYVKGARL